MEKQLEKITDENTKMKIFILELAHRLDGDLSQADREALIEKTRPFLAELAV